MKKYKRQRGFTLTEILVSLLLGMIFLYAMYEIFSRQGGTSRATSSLNDLQINGLQTMFALRQPLLNSGSGLLDQDVFEALAECADPAPQAASSDGVLYLSNPKSTSSSLSLRPLPIVINYGGKATANDRFDEIFVMVGAPTLFNAMTDFHPKMEGASPFVVSTTELPFALKKNEALVGIASNVCSIYRVSDVNINNVSLVGTGAMQAEKMVNLGQVKRWRYWVDTDNGNTLRADEYSLNADGEWYQSYSQPLISGVASFMAQYGIDTNDDNIIDEWVEASGDWSALNVRTAGMAGAKLNRARLRQIKSVRIALVARADEPLRVEEKESQKNESNKSEGEEGKKKADLITLFASCEPLGASCPQSLKFSHEVNNGFKWRYRTFETSVSLKNSVWNWNHALR